jgi:hypothetical protein
MTTPLPREPPQCKNIRLSVCQVCGHIITALRAETVAAAELDHARWGHPQ